MLLAFAFQAHAEIIGKAGRFGGITIRYKVILPNNYDPARAYPAVLAFAGGGQTLDGVNGMLDRNWREAETRGYIVVSPAAPSNNLFFERGGTGSFPIFSIRYCAITRSNAGNFMLPVHPMEASALSISHQCIRSTSCP
jgi:hypothetical protein